MTDPNLPLLCLALGVLFGFLLGHAWRSGRRWRVQRRERRLRRAAARAFYGNN